MKPHFLEILDPPLNGKRVISVISDTVFNDTTPKGKRGAVIKREQVNSSQMSRGQGKRDNIEEQRFSIFREQGNKTIYFRGFGQLTGITIPQGGPSR